VIGVTRWRILAERERWRTGRGAGSQAGRIGAGLAIFRAAVRSAEIGRVKKGPLLVGADPMHDAGAELGIALQSIGDRLQKGIAAVDWKWPSRG
jgi:hypothetical protein